MGKSSGEVLYRKPTYNGDGKTAQFVIFYQTLLDEHLSRKWKNNFQSYTLERLQEYNTVLLSKRIFSKYTSKNVTEKFAAIYIG